ncbi:hypothetical protein CPC08DRAFT_765475 [Agrocybe pediades]|nr:hypothetical protein CPC08DRAFT_765475 [Agrocybe pediades]
MMGNQIDVLSRDYGQYEQYEAAAAKYLVPYLSQHPPSALTFFVNPVDCGFTDLVSPPLEPYRRRFGIFLCTSFLSSSLLMKQLNNSACWSAVRELELQVMAPSTFDFGLQPGIVSTFTAFSSVTTLSTVDDALHLLLQEPSITSTLLPALAILRISEPHTEGEDPPPHHRFLQFRREIGKPISVLKMSFTLWRVAEDINMDYLEEHSGLLVEWHFGDEGPGPEQYMCGDGAPERLQLPGRDWGWEDSEE